MPTIREQHAFLDAAKGSDFSQVERLVLLCPGLVNCQPAGRWTALHQAAEKGNRRAVQFLLEHGASVSLRTRDGFMPVDVAKPAVFDILLEATLAYTQASEESKHAKSSCCANDEVLSNLALQKFGGPNDNDGDDGTCHICLDDFELGDDLRTLPCGHFFHMRCVDVWLMEKSSCCPVCRSDCATNSLVTKAST